MQMKKKNLFCLRRQESHGEDLPAERSPKDGIKHLVCLGQLLGALQIYSYLNKNHIESIVNSHFTDKDRYEGSHVKLPEATHS